MWRKAESKRDSDITIAKMNYNTPELSVSTRALIHSYIL